MGLLQGGLDLLQQLAAAATTPSTVRTGAGRGGGEQSSGLFQTSRDESTGQSFLQVRLPEPRSPRPRWRPSARY